VTDEELIARLRDEHVAASRTEAADRIEALVKEMAVSNEIGRAFEEDAGQQRVRAERLEAALHNCVGMLDQLVAESGRDIEWGAEDPFRMGEWFEPEDLAQIEQARTALKGDDHV